MKPDPKLKTDPPVITIESARYPKVPVLDNVPERILIFKIPIPISPVVVMLAPLIVMEELMEEVLKFSNSVFKKGGVNE